MTANFNLVKSFNVLLFHIICIDKSRCILLKPETPIENLIANDKLNWMQ